MRSFAARLRTTRLAAAACGSVDAIERANAQRMSAGEPQMRVCRNVMPGDADDEGGDDEEEHEERDSDGDGG